MIDTVRHFIGMDTLRRTVDAMWFYKLNVLHLHLTDDQGFRFRSDAYPELASPEAYSVTELAGLVAYAADRGVPRPCLNWTCPATPQAGWRRIPSGLWRAVRR